MFSNAQVVDIRIGYTTIRTLSTRSLRLNIYLIPVHPTQHSILWSLIDKLSTCLICILLKYYCHTPLTIRQTSFLSHNIFTQTFKHYLWMTETVINPKFYKNRSKYNHDNGREQPTIICFVA